MSEKKCRMWTAAEKLRIVLVGLDCSVEISDHHAALLAADRISRDGIMLSTSTGC